QGSTSAIPWMGLFSPVTLIDGVQTAFLGATPSLPGGHGPSNGQGVVYVLVTLGLIAASYGLMLRRYKKVGL
ncbi:MAG: ABC transporter permease, partial [Nonomuraea sp.]|nr:ABC transporter permease [Nonomuraea sp.]